MDGKGALKTSRNVIVGDCPDLSVPPVWAADLDVEAAYAAADIKSRDDLDRWAAEGLFCRFDIEQVLAGNFRFEYPLELSMTIDGHVRLEGGHLAKNGSISAFSKTILGGGEDVLAEDGGFCIEVPEFPSGTTFFLSAKIGKKNKKALHLSTCDIEDVEYLTPHEAIRYSHRGLNGMLIIRTRQADRDVMKRRNSKGVWVTPLGPANL